MERQVTTREANQAFSRLAREVESGESVTVTRNGRPVLRMVPVEVAISDRTADQEEILRRMRQLWAEVDARGPLPDDEPQPDRPRTLREEIYDDRVEELWARRKRSA